MAIREQLTPEQWKQLFNGPFAAATFASLASGGAFELIKEMFAASKFMGEAFQEGSTAGYGPVVSELLEGMKGLSRDEARELAPNFQSKDPDALRAEVKAAVLDAQRVAAPLPGADGYRRWLVDVARAAVQASRGGFLGIGASKEPVDEKEQAALNELSALLASA
jgi:hypothetical protein